jgi:peptide subunit release factor 1 (eRF1)
LKYEAGKAITKTYLLIDLSEAILADIYSDGEIRILFQETSFIPKKQRAGGQSAPRYARERQNKIKLWYKRINEVLMQHDRQIDLGIQLFLYKKLMSHLHTYNKEKIRSHETVEYVGLAGIYQKLENKKRKDAKKN